MAQEISLLGPPEIYAPPASTTVVESPTAAIMDTMAANVDDCADLGSTLTDNDDDAGDKKPESPKMGFDEYGDPFMDMMAANDDALAGMKLEGNPMMGYTENGAPTFLSTGNPCLDFFFHVVPNTPPETLTHYLQLAWDADPLMALKLICNLRGVRGTGKTDKESYYTAAIWLHEHHPKTLACNVAAMADFGYFKDFPEILHRLLEGADVRKKEKEEHTNRDKSTSRPIRSPRLGSRENPHKSKGGRGKRRERAKWLRNKRDGTTRDARIEANLKVQAIEKKNASIQRHAKKTEKAKKAVERFNLDPDYKFLHERVSDFFAESFKKDMELLNSGELKNISLAAKWCPSLDSMFDKSTLLCESIARKVFPKEANLEYQGIEDAHYAYRVRDRLRKKVLVPLRKALELPEVFIGANDWGSIPYNRVASKAMEQYKEKFLEEDKERFEEFLNKVKEGKAKIAAGALLPHEIIAALDDGDGGQVAELQWQRMVNDLAQSGKLKNCLAICDVSGSMSGIPMEVSVALGVLVSELCDEPWKGHVITFSSDPTLQKVQGDSLKAKIEFVRKMDWGCNTDFQKVFDRILEVAVQGKLKEAQMVKRLFVFSDMEFDDAREKPYRSPPWQPKYPPSWKHCTPDVWAPFYHPRDSDAESETDHHSSDSAAESEADNQANDCDMESGNGWETDYQAIVRKFTEKGYGNCVPEIVFWNLRNSTSTPAQGNQKGVALVSGFSKNMLTLFLEDNGELNSMTVMECAISRKEYEKLVVID